MTLLVRNADAGALQSCCEGSSSACGGCAVRGAVKCLSLFADELGDEQVAQVRIQQCFPLRYIN